MFIYLSFSAGNKCIAFHYNMYGNTVGELTMKLITEKNHSLDVFQESGSKGLDWQTYTFSLYAPLPFKVCRIMAYFYWIIFS